MLYIFIIYIIACLIGIKFKDNKKDFLSIENTICINGIFVGIILFSHFNSYNSYDVFTDIIYYKIIKRISIFRDYINLKNTIIYF